MDVRWLFIAVDPHIQTERPASPGWLLGWVEWLCFFVRERYFYPMNGGLYFSLSPCLSYLFIFHQQQQQRRSPSVCLLACLVGGDVLLLFPEFFEWFLLDGVA